MPNVTVSNHCDSTPLHLACKYANLEIIHALIKKGIDINRQNSAKYTALMEASGDGKADIVQILLDYDANVKKKLSWRYGIAIGV